MRRLLAVTALLLPVASLGQVQAGSPEPPVPGAALSCEEGRPDHARLPRGRPKVAFVAEGDRAYRMLPPDAIAAIDEPEMIPASEASGLLKDEEPVLGLFDGRRARAYPTWYLDAHEVVNDTIGGLPIAATWCPLANSGAVYVREVEGEVTTFGVSGTLWRDSLVLFDRKSGTYWSQVSGRAIQGTHEGAALREVPSVTTTWGAWRRLHPETLVLRPDARSRSGSPFAAYFADPRRLGITRSIKADPRLPGKSLVVGIRDGAAATAVPADLLAERSVVQGMLGGAPVAVVSVAARGGMGYDRRVPEGTLDFEAGPDGTLKDLQTGSTWDPESGRAVAGALAGITLRRIDSRPAYWFVWAAFHPGTEVLGREGVLRQAGRGRSGRPAEPGQGPMAASSGRRGSEAP